ncbi:hypothetical protein [Aestuariivirga litoralis]|nr:hypothetical protein [Aestuariivirga litoralis]
MFSVVGDGKFFLNTATEGFDMAGELDPRLIGLLRASLGFIDALRDIGVEGEIAVRLDRDGARRLVNVVDVKDRGRHGVNIAGLRFEWPKTDPVEAFAENDNDGALPLEDETPALK